MIDARRQTVEGFAGLAQRLAQIEALTHQQAADLSQLAGGAPRGHPTRRSATRSGQAVVLSYHRIAEASIDPFELAVTPDAFREHLDVMASRGHFVSVSELRERLKTGTLTDLSFTITFDDGYVDNLHFAKPILEQYGVPATVFIPTGCLGGTPFWWDELAELILSNGDYPRQLMLNVNGASYSWELQQTDRRRVTQEIWELVQPLDGAQRRQALDALVSQVGSRPRPEARSLTVEELQKLAASDLMELGAHTKTHPVLTQIAAEAARDEINGGKAWLEANLGRPITAFAYPYGDYGAREVELVREAGFDIAFSTEMEPVTQGCDLLEVPRLPVAHWSSADLEEQVWCVAGDSRGAPLPAAGDRGTTDIDFGDLRRLTPFSQQWGFDRGTPVDRHYIERFLEPRADLIRGRVLEMGEPRYTSMFGGQRVTEIAILEVTEGADATYTCRLEEGDEIPMESFDCIVCTHVLQYIYDVRAALKTLYRILKPGGGLLLTVPAITPTHEADQYGDAWHWSFTAASISRLCAEVFDADALEVEVFGNVLTATAFLYGLAASELTQDDLDHVDADYAVTVGIHAVK
jgi:peptidoglycan/xylan/chitin deacetylase (PgdA/CDA1 family)